MKDKTALTARQKRFVEEYLACGDGPEAAIAAGYSPAAAEERARELLRDLESGAPVRTVEVAASDQISITSMENDALRKRLEAMNVETMTPIEAMNELYKLRKLLD